MWARRPNQPAIEFCPRVLEPMLSLVKVGLLTVVATAVPAAFKTPHERLLVRVGLLALAQPAKATRRLVRANRPVLGNRTQLDLGHLRRGDRVGHAANHQRKANGAPPDGLRGHTQHDEPETGD